MFFEDREFDFLSLRAVFHGVTHILHGIGVGRSKVNALGIAANDVRSIAMNQAHGPGGGFYLRNPKGMDGFEKEFLTGAAPPGNGERHDNE